MDRAYTIARSAWALAAKAKARDLSSNHPRNKILFVEAYHEKIDRVAARNNGCRAWPYFSGIGAEGRSDPLVDLGRRVGRSQATGRGLQQGWRSMGGQCDRGRRQRTRRRA